MPKFLENKLKKEYGADSSIPYKVMNKLGYMKGSKETKKGKLADRKHAMAKKMLLRKMHVKHLPEHPIHKGELKEET